MRQEDQERADAADDAVRQQALEHRIGVELRGDNALQGVDAELNPLHGELRQPEDGTEETQHDPQEQNRAEETMQEQTVDGGTAAGLTCTFGDHAFEDHAQVCVMHERFGGHRVIARITDAVARRAEGLIPLRDGPSQAISRRRICIEEQSLRVGIRDRLTRVGSSGGRDIREGGGDIGWPNDTLHRGLLSHCAGNRPTHVEDSFALPGGRKHDGHAT